MAIASVIFALSTASGSGCGGMLGGAGYYCKNNFIKETGVLDCL